MILDIWHLIFSRAINNEFHPINLKICNYPKFPKPIYSIDLPSNITYESTRYTTCIHTRPVSAIHFNHRNCIE